MRAVLFDLGNTLVSYYAAADFAPILRQGLRGCVQALPGRPHTRDEEELFQRALAMNVERNDYSVWPLIDRLGELFGYEALDSPATEQKLITAFLAPIFATAAPDPEAVRALATLRAAGFATAIVSNTPWGSPAPQWRGELDRHNLLAAVDAAVFCVDVGYRKPHHAPFERALSLLDVQPADAVFVGDDPRWDVIGAKQAGLQPLLLAPRHTAPADDGVPVVRSLAEVLDRVTTLRSPAA